MFWSCPASHSLWGEIFRSLLKVTGKPIDPYAMIALFGVTPPTVPLSSLKAAFVTLLARRSRGNLQYLLSIAYGKEKSLILSN